MSSIVDSIIAFATLSPATILWRMFFWYFGWLPFAFAFLWGAKEVWLYYRQGIFLSKVRYTLLAIDVPRNNEQAASAVENIFSYLSVVISQWAVINQTMLRNVKLIKLSRSQGFSPILRAKALTTNL